MAVTEQDDELADAWERLAAFMTSMGIGDLHELLATGRFATEVDIGEQQRYANACAQHLYADVTPEMDRVLRGEHPRAAFGSMLTTLIGRVVASDHEVTIDEEGRAWIPDLCGGGQLMEVTEDRLTMWWWNLQLVASDELCQRLLDTVPRVIRDEAVERAGLTWRDRQADLFGTM